MTAKAGGLVKESKKWPRVSLSRRNVKNLFPHWQRHLCIIYVGDTLILLVIIMGARDAWHLLH